MLAWFESIVGAQYAQYVMLTVIALAALIVLLIVLRVLRALSSGTFVMGGRNRKARLAVMDATAVDATRRLVLVRRDDVEHLILIGGPTDVVVEQNIRPYAPVRQQPSESEAFLSPSPAAPRASRAPVQDDPQRAAERPSPATQKSAAPAAAQNIAPAPTVTAPVPQAPYAPPASAVERPSAPPVASPVQREFPPAPVSARAEPTLDIVPPHASPPVAAQRRDNEDVALEEEMNRLLSGFTSEPKR